MIFSVLRSAQAAAVRTARTAALSLIGTILLLVGLGFLTSALWILLARIEDALFAATVIGGIYVGLALVVFGYSAITSRRHTASTRPPAAAATAPPVAPASDPTAATLLAAFFAGLNAGRSARR